MPKSWRMSTLGEVAEVVSGGTPRTSNPAFWSGDVVWVTPTEIVANNGKTIFSSARTITEAGLSSSSAKLLPVDTVLLTSRATIGAVALAGVPLATNQGFTSLICREDVLPKFVMYWCQANKPELVARAGGNTFLEISRKKVAQIPILVPPLPEQRRIANLIGSIDHCINSLQTQVEATRITRSALLVELLSTPGKGWRISALGEVAEVVSGGTPRTSDSAFWNGDVVWVTPTEVVAHNGKTVFRSNRMITEAGLNGSSAKLLPVDTVLLTSRATIGAVALAGVPLATNQGFAALVCGKNVLPKFVMYWCQANKRQFVARAGGNTFLEVSRKKVAEVPINVPSLAEQKQIVILVESADEQIASLESQIDSAQLFRSGVLSELLSGKRLLDESYDVAVSL